MLKTYQFKTHCKGDSHSSKTANIILTGLVTKTKENALICASELIFKFNCTMLAETLCIVYYKTTWKPTSLCPQLHTYLHKQAQQTCLGVLRCLDGLLRRSAFTRKIRSTWTSAILHCSCVPTNSYHIITNSIYTCMCILALLLCACRHLYYYKWYIYTCHSHKYAEICAHHSAM